MRLVPKKKEILILPFLIRFVYDDVGRPDFLFSLFCFRLILSGFGGFGNRKFVAEKVVAEKVVL